MWCCYLTQCSREYFVHQTFLSYAHQSSPKWEATPVHCRRWIKASKFPGAIMLSYVWFYSFMERHTNLTVLTPKGPDLIRPKGATPEIIKKYFDTLEEIMDKYGFKDHPERIIYTDEWCCYLTRCSREYFAHQTFLPYAHKSRPKWEATPVHCRRGIKAWKSPGVIPLSYILFYSFMERHTNLTVLTPKGPDLIRPKVQPQK